MGRACKCKICGQSLTTDVAYKVVVKDKASYYCSATEYEDFQMAKEKEIAIRDAFNNIVTKIWGYKMVNTQFYKEKTEWLQIATEETITKYLQENEAYLSQAIARLSSPEFARIRYFSAIIKNSLKDFKPKIIEEIKAEPVVVEDTNFILHTNTKKKNNRRRGFSEEGDD